MTLRCMLVNVATETTWVPLLHGQECIPFEILSAS